MNELSNEKRFFKKVHPALEEVRHAAKDGLFTVWCLILLLSYTTTYSRTQRLMSPKNKTGGLLVRDRLFRDTLTPNDVV